MIVVSTVPARLVEEAWRRGAARWIDLAIRREQPARIGLEHVLADILAEKSTLWIAFDADNRADPIDAAAISQVIEHPLLREFRIPWIGGRKLWRWVHELDRMTTDMARAEGCTVMTGATRAGWRRFGYKEVGVLLQRIL